MARYIVESAILAKNILISALLKPDFLSVSDQFHLSRIISLSLHQLISKYCSEVRIKWPNDIYVDNRKIGGILIENMIQGTDIPIFVVNEDTAAAERILLEAYSNTKLQVFDEDKVIEIKQLFEKHIDFQKLIDTFKSE